MVAFVNNHPRFRTLKSVSPKTHTPDRHLHISGQRYYSPELGRWPSRDPIGEEGGLNVYGFVQNNSLCHIDMMGLSLWDDLLNSRAADWLICVGACIEDNDPVDLALTKALAYVAGMPLPKVFVASLARSVGMHRLSRIIMMPGASPFTTIPSALSVQLRAGGRSSLRMIGRYASPVVVAYGLAMAAIEVHCAAHCCGSRDYDSSSGNILERTREFFSEFGD